MAKKKSKTPAPPRSVQAPKRRADPASRDRRKRMYLIAAGALILLVIAGLASFLLGRGDTAQDALAAAGCTREEFPSQGRNHVNELEEGFEYSSTPATSGPHQPQPLAPAVWGTYDDPVPQEKVVHNLEHGGVIVQYGPSVPEETVDNLLSWYRDDPNGLIVAPLPPELVEDDPDLESRIALTAWQNLQTCQSFDEEAFESFVDLHRGDGPEPFPVEALTPGQQ
jgi:hypothetical protein